jgi:hypothetical protein
MALSRSIIAINLACPAALSGAPAVESNKNHRSFPMFFDYLAAEDRTLLERDSCGYQEEEQILQADWPCPKCGEGLMKPV